MGIQRVVPNLLPNVSFATDVRNNHCFLGCNESFPYDTEKEYNLALASAIFEHRSNHVQFLHQLGRSDMRTAKGNSIIIYSALLFRSHPGKAGTGPRFPQGRVQCE